MRPIIILINAQKLKKIEKAKKGGIRQRRSRACAKRLISVPGKHFARLLV